MAEKDRKRSWVMVNRAPVAAALWATVVAEVLEFDGPTPAHGRGVSPGI